MKNENSKKMPLAKRKDDTELWNPSMPEYCWESKLEDDPKLEMAIMPRFGDKRTKGYYLKGRQNDRKKREFKVSKGMSYFCDKVVGNHISKDCPGKTKGTENQNVRTFMERIDDSNEGETKNVDDDKPALLERMNSQHPGQISLSEAGWTTYPGESLFLDWKPYWPSEVWCCMAIVDTTERKNTQHTGQNALSEAGWTTYPGESLFLDWKPYRQKGSKGRSHYWCCLLVDDATGRKWSLFPQYKDRFASLIRQSFLWLKAKGFPCKYLCLDNAKDLRGLQGLCRELGITITSPAPHSTRPPRWKNDKRKRSFQKFRQKVQKVLMRDCAISEKEQAIREVTYEDNMQRRHGYEDAFAPFNERSLVEPEGLPEWTKFILCCDNDYELVIRMSKALEFILEHDFGAHGSFDKKIKGAKGLTRELADDLHSLQDTRNKIAHEPWFDRIPNRQDFLETFERAALMLERLHPLGESMNTQLRVRHPGQNPRSDTGWTSVGMKVQETNPGESLFLDLLDLSEGAKRRKHYWCCLVDLATDRKWNLFFQNQHHFIALFQQFLVERKSTGYACKHVCLDNAANLAKGLEEVCRELYIHTTRSPYGKKKKVKGSLNNLRQSVLPAIHGSSITDKKHAIEKATIADNMQPRNGYENAFVPFKEKPPVEPKGLPEWTKFILCCDNDCEFVIKMSKELEFILEHDFGAHGNGLLEKITNAKGLKRELVRDMQFLATIRNKLIHERGFDRVPNREAFVGTFERSARELERLPRNQSERAGA